jgi:hypothetical protein
VVGLEGGSGGFRRKGGTVPSVVGSEGGSGGFRGR